MSKDTSWLGFISLTMAEVPGWADTKTGNRKSSYGEKGFTTTRVMKYRRKQWRG
jgi:hypothetical protein